MKLSKGIGISTKKEQFDRLSLMNPNVKEIQSKEYHERVQKARALMASNQLEAIYVHAGTNLYYFTGMKWNPSERMVGAIITAAGEIHFIAPKFEEGTIQKFLVIPGEIHCWEEHQSPYSLFFDVLANKGISSGQIGLDESTPFFISNGLSSLNRSFSIIDAKVVTAGCRMYKSQAEIDIIKEAMDLTLEVQKAAGSILHAGITAEEVVDFIHECHIACGIPSGSYFCIVLFGVDSSFPHGVKHPKALEEGEIVLIDTGAKLHGYISDITRTYVYGSPTEEQRKIWNIEKMTQQAAFDAALIGQPCSDIDDAARASLVQHGLGPDYTLPGTPHRTGHGIGLDIHEWPYIVKGNDTILSEGMTFSNEPMICVPDKFGIRLEDHIYMDGNGPNWFTQPSESIDNPFNL